MEISHMRKVTLAAVILAGLTGCSTIGGFTDRVAGVFRGGDGGSTGVRSDRASMDTRTGYTGTPDYWYPNQTYAQYYGRGPYFDNKVWPPVWPGQAAPVQEMHSE
jgi:hypothetical protein